MLLLTSLPLVLPDKFTLEGGGSPALKALETRYRVVPISVTDQAELARGRLLLMAHPLAQPAEDLVALDAWVRGGGHVLLLADPMLEWPSARPLGDPLRPPPMFMDTGLLAHWGLRLDAPDERGPQEGMLGGHKVMTASPGRLAGRCAIGGEGSLPVAASVRAARPLSPTRTSSTPNGLAARPISPRCWPSSPPSNSGDLRVGKSQTYPQTCEQTLAFNDDFPEHGKPAEIRLFP